MSVAVVLIIIIIICKFSIIVHTG